MNPPRPRPHLAPGLRVVSRGRDHLQIGLYGDRRLLLPRTDDVERTLGLLQHRQPPDGHPGTAAVLDRLDQHGCLSWEEPARRTTGPAPKVAILGGLGVPGPSTVHELFAACGVTTSSSANGVDVAVVLSAGELDRDRIDPLLRSRTSHLVVRLVDGGAVLGPFVVPGSTACVRCIDAHESGRDPDHVAVTTRYVRATARPRPDGVPDLQEPGLALLALAWAVRDVLAHLRGRRPSTWSQTVVLGPDQSPVRELGWLRHPQCGCCWPAGAPASGTMEA